MKYGMPQVIVGILILIASIFVTGWMIFDAPEIYRQPAPEIAAESGYIDMIPSNNLWFSIARYGSWALPALGTILVIAGVARMAGTRAAALRAIPVLLLAGLIVASIGAIVTAWGFPSSFESAEPVVTTSGEEMHVMVFANYGRNLTVPQTGALFLVPLGLLAAGYGIIQFFKLRRQTASIQGS